MFDFEKLDVYMKAKAFHARLNVITQTGELDNAARDQLRRASWSIPLNIAEGSGRFTKPDRRNFFIIARSSVFECVAILDILSDQGVIEPHLFRSLYQDAEELSKILFALIHNLR
jgi:four helix bundle protein